MTVCEQHVCAAIKLFDLHICKATRAIAWCGHMCFSQSVLSTRAKTTNCTMIYISEGIIMPYPGIRLGNSGILICVECGYGSVKVGRSQNRYVPDSVNFKVHCLQM